MRISDPILVYGEPSTATHILVQMKDTENDDLFYSPREINNQRIYYTQFPEKAKYFNIKNFAEYDFHEIIENIHPSEQINIIFCDFANKNPDDISQDDIHNYISYKQPQIYDSFSIFLIELQDKFTTQRERIDSILRMKPQKEDEQILEIIEKFDDTELVSFTDETINDNKKIVTKGVLERYYNRNEIVEYSDQLKPNQTEKTKAQAGLRYTTSFKHPFGEGIIKEAIPPKIKTSIYEYFEPEIVYQDNNFLAQSDMEYTNYFISEYRDERSRVVLYPEMYNILLNYIKNLLEDLSDYDITKDFKDDFDYLKIQSKKPSVRVKLDPDILNKYPDAKLGSIVKKSKHSIGIIPKNRIIEYIEEVSPVKDTTLNIFPTSSENIPLQKLLTEYLNSNLYNIPIKQIKYKAKWLSGHITTLDSEDEKSYLTPLESLYTNQHTEKYGISIDVSNVAKREDLVDSLRKILIENVASKVKTNTTISVEFGERIIVKVEPFLKYIDHKENTLSIHAEVNEKPKLHNFTKAKWNQLYSEWVNNHRELIKENQLNQKFDIDSFWSINKNSIRTDKRIEPPVDDVYICYVNFHPTSNDIKIGRSKSWESRYSLYTRTNPPIKTIDPNSILRYYLKCPVHKDSVITNYLYVCMEDFFKQFSDKQPYLKRHKTEKGHVTEYYSINSNLELNDQLNQYVADLTEAFSNLTLKDLADIRKPSNKDGVHGGKRQEFFNKVNQYTKEQIYDVEQALQIVANLDNTTKFKDYPDFEKLFLPKFK
jgi:hypothetical protein